MLSICIPIYNQDITVLVKDLQKQGEQLSVSYEILLIDDASEEKYQQINKSICLPNVVYIQLEKNIGRAKIRNLFLQYIQYEYLLFLDCDSALISNNFLANYTQILSTTNCSVICGGRVCSETLPKRNKLLRWKYGTYREYQPLAIRQKAPNKSFMTNNFVIKRSVLEANRFNETIIGYGHEDTLFGYHLKKKGIQITPIENPILNIDIENNTLFLQKTEEGIKNLHHIYSLTNYDEELKNDISILAFFSKIKKQHLIRPISAAFYILKPIIKWLLSSGYGTLKMFDFYKLGLYIQYQNK